MVKKKWNETATINFVNEYTNQECLWNRKNKGYNNKTCRDAAYLEIAENMNLGSDFGIPEVKNKIKNLRNTYTQKIQKIKDSKKQGLVHVPSLKWFHLMDRVLKNGEKKRNRTSDSEDNSEIKREEPPLEVVKKKKIVPPSRIKKVKNKIEKDIEIEILPMTEEQVENHRPTILYTQTAKPKPVVLTEEFDAFGKLISLSLQNMSSERAIRSQQFIHTYLNKQRLIEIRNENNITRKRVQQKSQDNIEYETSDDNSEIDPFFKMELNDTII